MIQQMQMTKTASPTLLSPKVLSSIVALAVGGLVAVSMGDVLLTPVPLGRIVLGWAAVVFLGLVVQGDLERRRIPNKLTFPALLLAIVGASVLPGAPGLASSLAGVALAFAVLLLPFSIRAMTAGDVKAVMVLGALWGPMGAIAAIFWSTLASGLISIAILLYKGGSGTLFARWSASLGATIATRKVTYIRPSAGETAAIRMPRGLALALGVVGLNWWGVPWA